MINENIYTTVTGKILENIRDLGEIALHHADFAGVTIDNRLGRAMCTISWARLFYDKQIIDTDLLSKMADLLSSMYDLIKDKKYDDADAFIRKTIIYRIVKPSIYFRNFPYDAIPTLEKFVEELNFMR